MKGIDILIERIALAFIVFLGLIFVFLVPPFQKPDEIVHFYNSVMLTSKNKIEMENRFYFFPEKMKASKIAFNSDIKFNRDTIFYKDNNKEKHPYVYYQVNGFNFLGYLPSIIGIKIGSFFQYPAIAFYLARLFNFLFFLVGLFFALKIIDKSYRFILLTYAILPMLLHQATAINYDGLQFSLISLILALFISLMKSEKVSYWKLILFIEFLILFQLSKAGYYPISFLFLVVLLKILSKVQILNKNKWLYILLFFPVLPVFLWGFEKAKYFFGGSNQWPIFTNDPLYFFQVLANTWVEKRDFYLQSFLGYFGWLDYRYNFYDYLMVFLLIVVFLFYGLKRIEKPILTKFQLIILWFTVFSSISFLIVSFYFTWTKAGALVAEGTQGRYFLVIFPLAVLAIYETILWVGKNLSKKIFVFLIMVFIFFSTIKKINLRYYDFSTNFSNPNELIENYQRGKKENQKYSPLNSKAVLTKVFDTSNGDEIGGFEFVRLAIPNDTKINLPYKYLLMDGGCEKTYKRGYLNVEKLEKDEDYKEVIKSSVISKGGAYCLKIYPIVTPVDGYYFNYVMDDSKDSLIRLLFVKREQEYK